MLRRAEVGRVSTDPNRWFNRGLVLLAALAVLLVALLGAIAIRG